MAFSWNFSSFSVHAHEHQTKLGAIPCNRRFTLFWQVKRTDTWRETVNGMICSTMDTPSLSSLVRAGFYKIHSNVWSYTKTLMIFQWKTMNAPGAKQTEWEKSAKKLIFMYSECIVVLWNSGIENGMCINVCSWLNMRSVICGCLWCPKNAIFVGMREQRFTSTHVFEMLIRELIQLFIHQIYIAWVKYMVYKRKNTYW